MSRATSRSDIRRLAQQISSGVESTLSYLANIDVKNIVEEDAIGDSMDGVRALLACDFHMIDEIFEKLIGDNYGEPFLSPNLGGELAEAQWPVDVATISRQDSGDLLMQRFRSINPAEVRGKVKFTSHKMGALSTACFHPDGRWWSETNYVSLLAGKWVQSDRGMTRITKHSAKGALQSIRKKGGDINRTVAMHISIALTSRYRWHVGMSPMGAQSRILLPSSPAMCLEFFRDRDLFGALSRRSALRHWVVNHFRETHRSLAYVRDHLRGATLFGWRGLDCELLVSEFDLERNELFRAQAEQWRSRRAHNSVRVRLKRKDAA